MSFISYTDFYTTDEQKNIYSETVKKLSKLLSDGEGKFIYLFIYFTSFAYTNAKFISMCDYASYIFDVSWHYYHRSLLI